MKQKPKQKQLPRGISIAVSALIVGATAACAPNEAMKNLQAELFGTQDTIQANAPTPGGQASAAPTQGGQATATPSHRRTSIYAPPFQRAGRAKDKPESINNKPISMRLRDVPVSLFARMLSLATDKPVIVSPELKSVLNGSFNKEPRNSVLGNLATVHGWRLSHNGRTTLIHSASKNVARGEQLRSELFHLHHIEPKLFKEMVEHLFPDKKNKPLVVLNPQTRTVVVKGSAEMIERVFRLVEKTDVPVRQVFIEAFIIEAGEDFERRLGSRLGYDLRRGDLSVGGTVRPLDEGGLVLGDSGGSVSDLAVAGAAGGIGFLIDRNRLKFELTALEREGTTRIISNPRVFTLDNRRAVVFQGDEIPYLSVSDAGTQTQFREAGVRLEVTPTIIGDNRLLVRVRVNKDSVDTRRTNPAITRRSIETSLVVTSGAMAVIGGIYFDTQVNNTARLPWLGKLPFVGALFRNTSKQLDTRELLILLMPKSI